jgi:hypothetical protein
VNDCILFYKERLFDKIVNYITRYIQDERAYLLTKFNSLGIEDIFKFLLNHCDFFHGGNTTDIKAYTICKKQASTMVNYFCGEAYGSTITPKTLGTMIDILAQCVGFPINIIQCIRAHRNYYQGIRWNSTGLTQVIKQSSSGRFLAESSTSTTGDEALPPKYQDDSLRQQHPASIRPECNTPVDMKSPQPTAHSENSFPAAFINKRMNSIHSSNSSVISNPSPSCSTPNQQHTFNSAYSKLNFGSGSTVDSELAISKSINAPPYDVIEVQNYFVVRILMSCSSIEPFGMYEQDEKKNGIQCDLYHRSIVVTGHYKPEVFLPSELLTELEIGANAEYIQVQNVDKSLTSTFQIKVHTPMLDFNVDPKIVHTREGFFIVVKLMEKKATKIQFKTFAGAITMQPTTMKKRKNANMTH